MLRMHQLETPGPPRSLESTPADDLLSTLDEIARRNDRDYGLPLNSSLHQEMVGAVLAFATQREQEVARVTKQRCCELLCASCAEKREVHHFKDSTGRWYHGKEEGWRLQCDAWRIHEAFAKEGM